MSRHHGNSRLVCSKNDWGEHSSVHQGVRCELILKNSVRFIKRYDRSTSVEVENEIMDEIEVIADNNKRKLVSTHRFVICPASRHEIGSSTFRTSILFVRAVVPSL